MYERIGLSWEEIPQLRQAYYENYGTTLRGLQQHYQVDAEDYLAYVHDLPLEDYLEPDPELRELLLSLPQKRWIFTNADGGHARRVLKILEIEDCFEGIIDVIKLGFACKPQSEAYQMALEIAGKVKPGMSVLLDDSVTNLAGANQAGLVTVLVGSALAPIDVDFAVSDLMNLPAVMPELWNDSRRQVPSMPNKKPSGDYHGS